MRVLYVVNSYPDVKNPAMMPFVKTQIESIEREGADVEIFNIQGPRSKLNYLKSLSAVRRKMRGNSYDIIHGHYVYSGWIAAFQKQVPTVVSFMGSDLYGSFDQEGKQTFRGKVDIRLSKYLQNYVDGVIVKSQEMMNMLSKPEKALLLPNGIDLEIFKDIPSSEARKSLGLTVDKIFVLFAGNHWVTRKCFPVVEKAIEILKRSDARFEILVASGLPQEQVPLYMNAADVLALPSIKEGSPNVVKEALACNLPVVATDVGDVRELLGDLPGCRIAERTPEAFAGAIKEVVSREEPFNGREAVEHLRIERIAEQLMDFYAQVISRWKKEKKI